MRYSVLKFPIILSEAWKKFGDRELTVKNYVVKGNIPCFQGWLDLKSHVSPTVKYESPPGGKKKALPPKMEAVAMKTHYGNQTSITPHSAENYVINF